MIRPMTLHDLDPVLEIEVACYPDPWSRESWISEIERPSDWVNAWVILKNDRVIGALCGHWIEPEYELLKIALDPAFQGMGYGRIFLEDQLGRVRKLGAKKGFLEVRTESTVAQKLYHSLGFKNVFVRKNYYRNGEDAQFMECVWEQ